MPFRVLAFCACLILTLGIGAFAVLGQAPITPDPRLQERTTDGGYRIGNKLELRDTEQTWGPNEIRDCWAQMLSIELGFGHVPLEDEEDRKAREQEAKEKQARERVEEERDRPGRELAEDEQYKIRQERYWKDSNESRKKMGLPEIPRQEFETGLKLRLEERRKAREARRPKQESSGSEPQPTGSEPEPADTCLPYAAQREIDVDVFLRTRSAIRKQADALQNSNDPILRKVGGDLERLAEQVRPPEAGATPSTAPPAPISLWIHGWPPGAARNAGPGLVFDVASVSSFRDAGVLHLSNTWSGPPALPGSVYAERDQPRTVAPAPSLDPARWPSTSAPVPSLSLEEPAP